MGLLDDAIREHLELKRRRGADPAEVAREQREALEPLSDRAPSPDADASTEEHPLEGRLAPDHEAFAAEDAAQPQVTGDNAVEPARDEALPSDAPTALAGEGEAGSLEETAELDMHAVLEDEPLVGAEPAEHAEHREEGALEWEAPSELESGPGAETPPEQARLHMEHGPQADSAPER
jgi:hypothetical protein